MTALPEEMGIEAALAMAYVAKHWNAPTAAETFSVSHPDDPNHKPVWRLGERSATAFHWAAAGAIIAAWDARRIDQTRNVAIRVLTAIFPAGFFRFERPTVIAANFMPTGQMCVVLDGRNEVATPFVAEQVFPETLDEIISYLRQIFSVQPELPAEFLRRFGVIGCEPAPADEQLDLERPDFEGFEATLEALERLTS